MNKEKFIRKYARPDVFITKGNGAIIEHHQQLESDLNALLTETAEKQKKACYEEAEKAYQLGNPFFRAIRNTPLVTQTTEE